MTTKCRLEILWLIGKVWLHQADLYATMPMQELHVPIGFEYNLKAKEPTIKLLTFRYLCGNCHRI